jgi:hypothetical protein
MVDSKEPDNENLDELLQTDEDRDLQGTMPPQLPQDNIISAPDAQDPVRTIESDLSSSGEHEEVEITATTTLPPIAPQISDKPGIKAEPQEPEPGHIDDGNDNKVGVIHVIENFKRTADAQKWAKNMDPDWKFHKAGTKKKDFEKAFMAELAKRKVLWVHRSEMPKKKDLGKTDWKKLSSIHLGPGDSVRQDSVMED